MPVNSAIDIGMSGLLGFSQELQTISNNVANLNTPGFKGSETQFTDFFSQNNSQDGGSNSATGNGLQVLPPVINFTAGQTTQTGIGTNMVDSGSSFFVLKDPKTGQISYTQDGQFQFNSSGVLTDSTGKLNVQALNSSGQLSDLSQGTLQNNPAKATASVTLNGNISTVAGATNQVAGITVYDANGGSHTLTATFTQSATAGTWTVAIQDGTTTVASGGSFVFSSTTGAISTATGSDGFQFNYTPTGGVLQTVNLTLAATSTSNANAAQLSVQTSDGNAAGTVTNVSFDQNGTMQLEYSNGQTASGASVALANFASTSDLRVNGSGNNSYVVTNNSEAKLGTAGIGSAWGSITPDAIQASNVDLSTEFSEIIITQRGYQAASELISTANQMMQNVLDMKGQSSNPAVQAVHPFALLKQREISACVALAQEVVREWKDGWCPGAVFEIDCVAASDAGIAPDGHWSAHGTTRDAALWRLRSHDFARQAERMIFELDQTARNNKRRAVPDLAEKIAQDAAESLSTALLRRLSSTAVIRQPDGGAPPAWLLRRSAGAAWLRLSVGGQSLCVLVPNALLPGRSKPVDRIDRAPLTSLSNALTGITAHLHAELGQVEMSLGQLTSLEIGDVITLPIGIDQPLQVFAGKRRLVGHAYLGKQDGHRAVEMLGADKKVMEQAMQDKQDTQMTDDNAHSAPQLIELPDMPQHGGQGPGIMTGALDAIEHVKVKLTVQVGDAHLTVGELRDMKEEQVVKLESLADAPVDILLEGRIVARGQLVAVDDNFGVRITELPKARS